MSLHDEEGQVMICGCCCEELSDRGECVDCIVIACVFCRVDDAKRSMRYDYLLSTEEAEASRYTIDRTTYPWTACESGTVVAHVLTPAWTGRNSKVGQ